jgi:hypothetical protein
VLSRGKREKLRAEIRALRAKLARKPKDPFERKRRVRAPKPARLIAYDFETETIREGTPRPLYLTAYCPGVIHLATEIKSLVHLRRILVDHFLTDENLGSKFVAWNGNRFDAYYVAAALVGCDDYVIRPYLTQGHALRGLRIVRAIDVDDHLTKGWEFVCGMAMTGLEGVALAKFTANFAPDHAKLAGVIDFEAGQQFDPANPEHREYAMRDSIGLWHAIDRAQRIMLAHFDEPLAVTMGGACIKVFQAHMPRGVVVHALDESCEEVFRQYVMRGGYCYLMRRHVGPIWKYDVNQAYAAAMRETPMPCGACYYWPRGLHSTARVYIARLKARNPRNVVPFYYRTEVNGKVASVFGVNEIAETWLTSVEIDQLRSEGWQIEIFESYQWEDSFTMSEYVDRLETLRMNCDGGPSGPIGTMVKAVGNHSYGKTVEEIPPIRFALATAAPPGYEQYFDDADNAIQHVFYRLDPDQRQKNYHAVQIGAFITASVRMKLRRAALLAPASFLYADTDCVVFDSDVTHLLDVHPSRYGAWKVEESGTEFAMIAKKVYAEVVSADEKPAKRSAKGLNVKRLSGADFAAWAQGTPPVQEQVQRQNFLVVLQGAEMFRRQVRRGTRVEMQARQGDESPAG